jgi:hypothetical protein
VKYATTASLQILTYHYSRSGFHLIRRCKNTEAEATLFKYFIDFNKSAKIFLKQNAKPVVPHPKRNTTAALSIGTNENRGTLPSLTTDYKPAPGFV